MNGDSDTNHAVQVVAPRVRNVCISFIYFHFSHDRTCLYAEKSEEHT